MASILLTLRLSEISDNTSPSSKDALDGGVIVSESFSKPGCLTSKSARDTSDRTSCRVTSGCPGKENSLYIEELSEAGVRGIVNRCQKGLKV